MDIQALYVTMTAVFETIGVLVISFGLVMAAAASLTSLARRQGGRAAVQVLRTVLGGAILLGLEIFVAADLIRTITEQPTLTTSLALLIIVAVRTILSWTIQIEMDGILPWKRALFESGAVVAARGVKSAVS